MGGFTVGRASHHYRLLEFYIPATRGYRLSGTYRLYPQHCRMPVISEEDRTVSAATELLEKMKKETMVEDNQETTGHPLPWRTEGGDAGRIEGGHSRTGEGGWRQHNLKQPHMPADTQDDTKNAP